MRVGSPRRVEHLDGTPPVYELTEEQVRALMVNEIKHRLYETQLEAAPFWKKKGE